MPAKKIGVFFGGQSPEHDVSILTGLQVCQVMDVSKYEVVPVYVDMFGGIWTGDALLNKKTYPLTEETRKKLTKVIFAVGNGTDGHLIAVSGLIKKKIKLDAAFLACHGGDGESGMFQGMFESANLPYAGASVLASSVYMSKYATKLVCRALGIKVLPETIVPRPHGHADLLELAKSLDVKYPVIVKPESLGSSIGVSRANNAEELAAGLALIFKMDPNAFIEPFVENLKEYNVAVISRGGKTITSAIESPNGSGKLLSFDDKYKGGGAKKKKVDADVSVMPTDELIHSTREFAPEMPAGAEEFMRESATKLFDAMGASGAPRIDFYSDSESGEIWMNEVNPVPGAFAFHLWRVARVALSYQEIVSTLIDNAFARASETNKTFNLNTAGSVIFKK